MFWLGLAVGFIFRIVLGMLFHRLDYGCIGTVLIDDTDEDKTLWTLRYDEDPDDISKHKTIKLRVHVKSG